MLPESGFGTGTPSPASSAHPPPQKQQLVPIAQSQFSAKKIERAGRKILKRGAICSPLSTRLFWVVYINFKQILCALCWHRVRKICYLSFRLTVNGMGSTSWGLYGEIGL